MSAESFWVAVKTKAQREAWAAENIVRQGFKYYLPLVAPDKPVKGKLPKPQCLFPRYMFVQTEGRWRCLLGTYGVLGLVMCGQKPSVVPDREIATLRSRENAEGLIMLSKPGEEFRFNNGDKVKVNSGVFSGYSGIYDRDPQNRVFVLLDFLGRYTPVPLDESALEAV